MWVATNSALKLDLWAVKKRLRGGFGEEAQVPHKETDLMQHFPPSFTPHMIHHDGFQFSPTFLRRVFFARVNSL